MKDDTLNVLQVLVFFKLPQGNLPAALQKTTLKTVQLLLNICCVTSCSNSVATDDQFHHAEL
jgi:hypothetical protein